MGLDQPEKLLHLSHKHLAPLTAPLKDREVLAAMRALMGAPNARMGALSRIIETARIDEVAATLTEHGAAVRAPGEIIGALPAEILQTAELCRVASKTPLPMLEQARDTARMMTGIVTAMPIGFGEQALTGVQLDLHVALMAPGTVLMTQSLQDGELEQMCTEGATAVKRVIAG